MSKNLFAAQKNFRKVRLLDLKDLSKLAADKQVGLEWTNLSKANRLLYADSKDCDGNKHPPASPFFKASDKAADTTGSSGDGGTADAKPSPDDAKPSDASTRSGGSSSSSFSAKAADTPVATKVVDNASKTPEETKKEENGDDLYMIEKNAKGEIVETVVGEKEKLGENSAAEEEGKFTDSAGTVTDDKQTTEDVKQAVKPLSNNKRSRGAAVQAMIEAHRQAHEEDKFMVARKKKYKEEPIEKIIEKHGAGEPKAKKAKKSDLPPEPVFMKRGEGNKSIADRIGALMKKPCSSKDSDGKGNVLDLTDDDNSNKPKEGVLSTLKQKLQASSSGTSVKKDISLEELARNLDQSRLKCDSALDMAVQGIAGERGEEVDQLIVTDSNDTRDTQTCMKDRVEAMQREERLRAMIDASRRKAKKQ